MDHVVLADSGGSVSGFGDDMCVDAPDAQVLLAMHGTG